MNVATQRQITTFAAVPGPVTSVAFSQDGQMLAISGTDRGFAPADVNNLGELWNVTIHRQIAALTAPPLPRDTPLMGVPVEEFSPDGKILATGAGGPVRLWDVATHRLTGDVPTASPVSSLAFSPDGQVLATGDADGAVQLWDVATQQQITAFTAGPEPVTSVAFSPDGQTLASASTDHTVRRWDVAYLTGDAKYLCASAGRSLTRAEWARYLPGLPYERTCP